MKPKDFAKICHCTIAITKEVGQFIVTEKKNFNYSDVEQKGKNDLVSYVDRRAEEMLVEKLSVLFPEAGFIAEEGTGEANVEGWNWVIDPLDGTANFVHDVSLFGVSVALIYEKETKVGVVYEPNSKECFYAYRGGGAFLDGVPLKVSNAKTVEESLVATGFPQTDFTRIRPYMELLEVLMKNTHGIRRMGAAAIDLAYLAAGRFDCFYEYNLNPWDVAAGTLLVQEAGGMVTDFQGEDNYLFGKEIIAANSSNYKTFSDLVRNYF
ncbi:inositol monophosphatase family protein [Flammeovirga sp. OC4]|uniref:inositol monophosphatase family protein n=1 Tax=Flammeovirga sp. OC4 TaxID=1382345 RepID=UPI0005C674C3|nr:inositol monophosphatase family protein [Flammeovirga sp. OC4]